MFPFFRKARKASTKQRFTRHHLGVDTRLENRLVPATIAMANNILAVEGTNGADQLQLQVTGVSGSRSEQMVTVSDGGHTMGMFPLGELKRIEIRGLAGDDKISVTGALRVPTIIDGGDGNDSIAGGDTGAIILGRSGNDSLSGGAGRDVLIGGQGADIVKGGGGDDIVIGDATQADDDTNALFNILEKWNSSLSYDERVKALRPNPEIMRPNRVPDLTLIDDGATDFLEGGSGQDWFLTLGSDKITDHEKQEAVM
jgi:Ca2+-binding RTX toxin-like protein